MNWKSILSALPPALSPGEREKCILRWDIFEGLDGSRIVARLLPLLGERAVGRASVISVLASLLLTSSLAAATYSNPVLPGDFPDPSVIRVGNEYWATATTSEWAPLFPLLRSRDLVNWEHVGNVFQKRPEWSVA